MSGNINIYPPEVVVLNLSNSETNVTWEVGNEIDINLQFSSQQGPSGPQGIQGPAWPSEGVQQAAEQAAQIAATKADEASASAAAADADRVQTGLDVQATAADRAQVAIDAAASAANAAIANTKAWEAAGSAAQALAIYGDTAAVQTAVAQAAAQASLAAGYAASASSVVQQDLSGVNAAALHRSPNAVTALFVYDTSKDSDGGAWTEKCQHTSWYNEAINGSWLGAQASELQARNEGAVLGPELVTNGDFSSGTTGWNLGAGSGALSTVGGRLRITSTVNGATTLIATSALTTVIGKTYKVVLGYGYKTVYNVFNVNVSNALNGTSAYSTNSFGGVGAGSIGTSVVVFTATATTTYVVLRADPSASNVIGDYVEFDNISVREVTAQTTQTGDYFQLTTDGKFYRLNATSGTTEVFRGNKRDFPRLAGIVAETNSVNIYDLTEPGRPMWMRFVGGASGNNLNFLIGTAASPSIFVMNGVMNLGYGSNGLIDISFGLDRGRQIYSGGVLEFSPNRIASRNSLPLRTQGATQPAIANSTVNAVAMAAMPDAPVDPVTGLKVPTIAVGTQGGTSFIRHDGTVVSNSTLPATVAKLLCTTEGVWASRNASVGQVYFYSYRSIYSGAISSPPGYAFGTPIRDGGVYVLAGNRTVAIAGTAGTLSKELTLVRVPTDIGIKRTQATIANTFNTGHMVGDIRRAYLADVGAGSVTGPELVTNGTFDTDTTGWTKGTGWTISGGIASRIDTGAISLLSQTITLVPGATYRIQFTCTVVSGSITATFGGGTTVTGVSRSSTGSYVEFLVPISGNVQLRLSASTTFAGSIDNISVKEVVADRSYKAQGTSITGTLTKTAVASAAQLVAYSGFSSANYLREPYSADLDFGTGEWTCSAWVNVPTTLPGANFPAIGSAISSSGRSLAGGATDNGNGTFTIPSGGSIRFTYPLASLENGAAYRVTIPGMSVSGGTASTDLCDVASFTVPNGQSGDFVFVSGRSTYDETYRFVDVLAAPGTTVNLSSPQLARLASAPIADRAHSSGSRISLGVTASGFLTATAFDGTTTRTVTTSAAYNTATWLKARANYRAGRLSILVNGVEVAVTNGAPLLTLNNSNAVLTIGNSFALDAPFPGSIALLKFSATVPTAEQSVWMYEQEKQMFREGAQVCLPDSGSIVDLTYDDATDKWIAVSAANESEWSGLVRTSVTPVPAGSYAKVAASSGIQLLARSTTNPGVDITIPTYGLREELVKRSELAAKYNQDLVIFDYDVISFTASTISGTNSITASSITGTPYIGMVVIGTNIPNNTTITNINGTVYTLSQSATGTGSVSVVQGGFDLPVGYTTKTVYTNGTQRREGTARDYIKLFDGFKEQVRFNSILTGISWVQLHAVKEVQ